MKYQLLTTALVISLFNCNLQAQMADGGQHLELPQFEYEVASQQIIYKATQEQAGTKEELYEKATNWLLERFESPFDVIRYKSSKEGKMEGSAEFAIHKAVTEAEKPVKAGTIQYDFYLEFEEGKYHYIISNINLRKETYFGIENWVEANKVSYDGRSRAYLIEIDHYLQDLIAALQGHMEATIELEAIDWEQ